MPQSQAIDYTHFSPDTFEFIRLLSTCEVKYVVVGGEAVIFHGYPRFTGDVDFFFSDKDSNVQSLFKALSEFWSGDVPGISSAQELAEPGIVIQFGRPPNRIDLLNRIDGVSFEEAWTNRITLQLTGIKPEVSLFMLDRASLLRNKLASARPKDLDDLRVLKDHF